MDEREALKREIELLQNLIDEHKSIHGDTPFARVQQRLPETLRSARGHSTSVVHSHGSRGRLYASQGSASWRKIYSLRNKSPLSSVGLPSFSPSSSVHLSRSQNISLCPSMPSHSRGEQSVKSANLSSGISLQMRQGHENCVTQIRGVATEKGKTDALRKTGASLFEPEDGKRGSSSTDARLRQESPLRRTEESQHSAESSVVLPEKKASVTPEDPSPVKALISSQGSSQGQNKLSLTSKISTDTKETISMVQTPAALVAGRTVPPRAALPQVSKQLSCNPTTSQSSYYQVRASFLKKSKFTWVKSQNEGGVEPKQAKCISSPTVKAVSASLTSVSKTGTTSISSQTSAISKRTPAKKFPRKLSPVIVAPKISKYKWVSSSVGVQAKISRKSISPKASTPLHRALEKNEANKKFRVALAPSAKIKKEIMGSSAMSLVSSCYRWRADSQSTMVAVTAGAAVACRRSAFHWTSEKNNKGGRGGLVVPPSVTQRTSLMTSFSSPGAFKLRSTMKIIRKTANSGGGSVKGTNSSAVKFSLRGRTHCFTRSPMGVRRTPPRELVSFGRHKLRRLSTSFSRTSPSASSSHRESGSRFKTRLGCSGVHTLHFNPALSWRAKRIQSARSFLQSRLRVPHYRHPSSTQPWRGSSMCWIRGSLYRVSANKLSRTVTSGISINRTGRSFSSQAASTSAALNRPSSTRHLASRAVQRSLAIIRHANQKKQPKQYCMYYNRFGKCNRGNSCPYIHDPDKVAVCTRFLRGTCKQAAGTCPFSHKVAKEKMPVCSYFLKGICNNSNCPYSHVYVSRKAEVCEEFVKGYCPEGEKCKKKHTLVCPDFSKAGSCPRGARCKLQHRQRAKRSSSGISTTPGKRVRTKDSSKRPCLSFPMLQDQAVPGSPTKGPLALPSFISLSSSPEEADAPDTVLAETSEVKEKKLQIKPRL